VLVLSCLGASKTLSAAFDPDGPAAQGRENPCCGRRRADWHWHASKAAALDVGLRLC